MALQSCFFLVFVALMMTVQLHSVLGNIQVCSTGYSLHGGYCYKTSPGNFTAEQAQEYCTREGGIAAEPKSQEEHDNIKSFLTKTSWIGIVDLHTNASYVYVSDNKSVGFRSIADSPGNGQCVAMDRTQDYNWILTDCTATHPVVCQQVPTGNMMSTAVLPSSGPVMLNMTVSFKGTDSMTETPIQGPHENTEDSTTAGLTVQSTSSRMGSEDFPIVRVATVVGSALGFLLLLAVLLYFYRRRYIAESQVLEDNTPAQLDKGIGQVGRRESRPVEHDDVENTYQTIQDSAVNSTELPAIPTAPPSEYNQNYSTIPDLKSSSTVDRVDERAPAPPPNQTEQSMFDYYSVLYDYIAASVREDQAGTSDNADTSQEPEYAAIAPTN
ncbi:NCAN [Branchiostoma lanceolatum]|uniref:NCAN protein n=1 Tax=Branchiostoma lanceolatum TaxID=7740 RepID=A0A8J9YXB7_BRALA|nr:NCAN [Branchiostoma lanceolatum]